MTREQLQRLIDGFTCDNLAFANDMKDPVLAQNMCTAVSIAFVAWCLQHGESIDDVETIVVEGSDDHHWTNHSWEHRVHFKDYWHMIARVGPWYLDWSIRQLDKDAPVPKVYTLADLKLIWRDISTSADYEAAEAQQLKKLRDLGILDDDEEEPTDARHQPCPQAAADFAAANGGHDDQRSDHHADARP